MVNLKELFITQMEYMLIVLMKMFVADDYMVFKACSKWSCFYEGNLK